MSRSTPAWPGCVTSRPHWVKKILTSKIWQMPWSRRLPRPMSGTMSPWWFAESTDLGRIRVAGGMQVLLATYPAEVSSIGGARHDLEHALEEEGLDVYRERGRLLLDELVWNVVLHAHTEAAVRVTSSADQLLIEVADGNVREPAMQVARPEDIAGRGLMIVDALADAWGWLTNDRGKVVWARLDADSPRGLQSNGHRTETL